MIMGGLITNALSMASGGGSSTIDICDWVETLPILSGGNLANNYHFRIRYGWSEKSAQLYSYNKAESSFSAFWYLSEERLPMEFYFCVYSNNPTELKCVFKYPYSGMYSYQDKYHQIYAEPKDSFVSDEYRFKEIRVLQLYPVTYKPSDLTANGYVYAQVQLMFQVDTDATYYDWNYRTMERYVTGTQVDTQTATITATIPSSTYSDEVFSPLSDADYRTFLQDFTDDIIDYLSNQ